jgi:5-methylcytosine-specific restriction endonuclease McrA
MTKRYRLLAEFNKRDKEGNLLCRNFAECNNPVKKPYRYYCSKECQQKIIREAYSFLYFRSDCLKRDNYTCQKCGAKDSDSLKFHDYNPIEVHHIIPVQYGGSNDKSNGITLCFRCHVKTHRELKND